MNELDITEVYYILCRRRGQQKAEYFLDTMRAGLPIMPCANTFEDIIAAAGIKAEYLIAFADSFAVATTCWERAILLTGDPEFQKV